MRLITSTLFTLYLSSLLSSLSQADSVERDVCWCYSDNMVGYAQDFHYYNKKQQKTYRWITSCTNERVHGPSVVLTCSSPGNTSSCTPLPDVRKYSCSKKAWKEHCNKDTGPGRVCVENEWLTLDETRRDATLPWSRFMTQNAKVARSNYGVNCEKLCNLVFLPDKHLSRGLKPLCNSTYLRPDKDFGKELPISMVRPGWTNKLAEDRSISALHGCVHIKVKGMRNI